MLQEDRPCWLQAVSRAVLLPGELQAQPWRPALLACCCLLWVPVPLLLHCLKQGLLTYWAPVLLLCCQQVCCPAAVLQELLEQQ